MAEATTQRIIPGAPPPPAQTKSQLKKKRKVKTKASENTGDSPVEIPDITTAALVEKAPEPSDIQEGTVASELVAQPSHSEHESTSEDASVNLSPIVELVNKRLKAVNKKLTRITTYTAMDPSSLNEDQKRAISSLSALEAVSKELSEVKKAVESHEAELAVELASKRRAAEEAERARIAKAVSAAEASIYEGTGNLLSFIRMRALVASSQLDLLAFGASQEEDNAVHAAGEVLLGSDSDAKEVVHGFLSLDGQFEGVPYSRFLEICDHVFSPPPQDEAPVPDEPLQEVPVPEEAPETAPPTAPLTMSGSFHFMQESEIEPLSTQESTEWVKVPEVVEDSKETPEINSHVEESGTAPEVPASAEPIDWAAEDEDELPDIDNLHATFGKSGSATPNVQPEPQDAVEPRMNGDVSQSAPAEDGFTQARGGRGRGRGFRGGERRGNFRGGERGGFRGGEGRGGFRGGFRGGERGGFRRGSDGEFRGRGGRGRGRGGGFSAPAQA